MKSLYQAFNVDEHLLSAVHENDRKYGEIQCSRFKSFGLAVLDVLAHQCINHTGNSTTFFLMAPCATHLYPLHYNALNCTV